MIIEEIIEFLGTSIANLDRFEFIISAIIFALPPIIKVIKNRLRKYYTLISGIFTYILIIFLISIVLYKNPLFVGGELLVFILITISLKEVYSSLRGKRFNEVYEVLEDYSFYKNIDINIVGFKFTEHDLERIKFMIRSNFNILSLYNEIGDLKVKIENKKTYLNLELDFKFNKNAKDYEIENIVARYEELEEIEYISSFDYKEKLNKIEITIKDENN